MKTYYQWIYRCQGNYFLTPMFYVRKEDVVGHYNTTTVEVIGPAEWTRMEAK